MTERQDERQLVGALVAGDAEAWLRFVQRFHGLVYARVRSTLLECSFRHDLADVEDLCADVFACLVANDCAALRQFEGRSTIATWLCVITRRTCLRALSKRVNSQLGSDATEAVSAASEPGQADALNKLIDEEDTALLYAMLEKLNDGDREVLRLFYLEGRSYQEIGARLNVTVNAVGPKLQRAQKRLRRLLDPTAARPSGKRR